MLRFDEVLRDLFNDVTAPLRAAERRRKAPEPESPPLSAFIAPEQYLKAAQLLLRREEAREAVKLLEPAYRMKPADPHIKSYYGLSLAMSRVRGSEAIRLCEEAVRPECFHSELYLNLGRVYLLSGQRAKAHRAFLAGMQTGDPNPELAAAMQSMGVRSRPPIAFLPRRHPVNKFAGLALARLGLR